MEKRNQMKSSKSLLASHRTEILSSTVKCAPEMCASSANPKNLEDMDEFVKRNCPEWYMDILKK